MVIRTYSWRRPCPLPESWLCLLSFARSGMEGDPVCCLPYPDRHEILFLFFSPPFPSLWQGTPSSFFLMPQLCRCGVVTHHHLQGGRQRAYSGRMEKGGKSRSGGEVSSSLVVYTPHNGRALSIFLSYASRAMTFSFAICFTDAASSLLSPCWPPTCSH